MHLRPGFQLVGGDILSLAPPQKVGAPRIHSWRLHVVVFGRIPSQRAQPLMGLKWDGLLVVEMDTVENPLMHQRGIPLKSAPGWCTTITFSLMPNGSLFGTGRDILSAGVLDGALYRVTNARVEVRDFEAILVGFDRLQINSWGLLVRDVFNFCIRVFENILRLPLVIEIELQVYWAML